MPGRLYVAEHIGAQAELTIVDWAEAVDEGDSTCLRIKHGPRPEQMHGAPEATGQSLVSNGHIGADVIRLPAGGGFAPHTHPGHHLLIVLAGEGTITYDGTVYPTRAGQIYMIEGEVPHAVGAVTDHVILAAGAPHKAVDSTERMALVDYEEVISPIGDMTCLICDTTAAAPTRLHDEGCSHCPCHSCVGVDEPADEYARDSAYS
jgi:quercetin dioxygenase-like cupin family protein